MKPEDVASWWAAVDDGDIAAMCEMQEEMEAKDAHLQGIANTRRQGLTALDWDVISGHEREDDQRLGTEVADYCRRVLRELRTFPETLEHLALAIGPGISAVELVWRASALGGVQLIETVDVPGHRLNREPMEQVLRVVHDKSYEGSPMLPGKFMVFTPKSRGGFAMRVTMTRATAYLFVIKHYALADWTAFSEVFGMPWRVAILGDAATDTTKNEAATMLKNMAADTYAVFHKNEIESVELKETSRASQPYSELIKWAETTLTILWLGQTLTTKVDDRGSFAAAKVHENVRTSILLADIAEEARCIREQLLRPMVNYRWPGQRVPIPHFRRTLHETQDVALGDLRIRQLEFANSMNLPVEEDEIYEALSLKRPTLSLKRQVAKHNTRDLVRPLGIRGTP